MYIGVVVLKEHYCIYITKFVLYYLLHNISIVLYLLYYCFRSLWTTDKFLSYVGLDQPPVEPSSEDTCGINRSHVSDVGLLP